VASHGTKASGTKAKRNDSLVVVALSGMTGSSSNRKVGIGESQIVGARLKMSLRGLPISKCFCWSSQELNLMVN
jgi:hypothetical protein